MEHKFCDCSSTNLEMIMTLNQRLKYYSCLIERYLIGYEGLVLDKTVNWPPNRFVKLNRFLFKVKHASVTRAHTNPRQREFIYIPVYACLHACQYCLMRSTTLRLLLPLPYERACVFEFRVCSAGLSLRKNTCLCEHMINDSERTTPCILSSPPMQLRFN